MWGAIIVGAYAITVASFTNVSDELVNLKMLSRSLDQASRVVFYANELALDNVGVDAWVFEEGVSQTLWCPGDSWCYPACSIRPRAWVCTQTSSLLTM